jgi:uncharacterized membrane protein YagU involved in acid resistance
MLQRVIASALFVLAENFWKIIIKSSALSGILIVVLKYPVIRTVLALPAAAAF